MKKSSFWDARTAGEERGEPVGNRPGEHEWHLHQREASARVSPLPSTPVASSFLVLLLISYYCYKLAHLTLFRLHTTRSISCLLFFVVISLCLFLFCILLQATSTWPCSVFPRWSWMCPVTPVELSRKQLRRLKYQLQPNRPIN